MTRKIIIAVAPTGGWGNSSNNPVHPDVIAEDIIRCAAEGAGVVHMHARDEQGRLTTDLSAYSRAVDIIKESCDIILEASTGGLSTLSASERVLPAGHRHAEMGSLNIGSLNFGDDVYQNSLPDVRFWIESLKNLGVKPSLEIFDTGHLETALALLEGGLVTPPCNFSFIFNVRWGMPFYPKLLEYLKSRLPGRSLWAGLFIQSEDFSNHVIAAHAGATILRTGFEDSFRYNGNIASCNAELVKTLRRELEAEGFDIATVEEARSLLFRE